YGVRTLEIRGYDGGGDMVVAWLLGSITLKYYVVFMVVSLRFLFFTDFILRANAFVAPMAMRWCNAEEEFPCDLLLDEEDANMVLETALKDNPTRITKYPKEFLILVGLGLLWYAPCVQMRLQNFVKVVDPFKVACSKEKLESSEVLLLDKTANVVTAPSKKINSCIGNYSYEVGDVVFPPPKVVAKKRASAEALGEKFAPKKLKDMAESSLVKTKVQVFLIVSSPTSAAAIKAGEFVHAITTALAKRLKSFVKDTSGKSGVSKKLVAKKGNLRIGPLATDALESVFGDAEIARLRKLKEEKPAKELARLRLGKEEADKEVTHQQKQANNHLEYRNASLQGHVDDDTEVKQEFARKLVARQAQFNEGLVGLDACLTKMDMEYEEELLLAIKDVIATKKWFVSKGFQYFLEKFKESDLLNSHLGACVSTTVTEGMRQGLEAGIMHRRKRTNISSCTVEGVNTVILTYSKFLKLQVTNNQLVYKGLKTKQKRGTQLADVALPRRLTRDPHADVAADVEADVAMGLHATSEVRGVRATVAYKVASPRFTYCGSRAMIGVRGMGSRANHWLGLRLFWKGTCLHMIGGSTYEKLAYESAATVRLFSDCQTRNQLAYERTPGNNYDFPCFDQPPQYHIDQSPPQDLDSHSHCMLSARENNCILEEILRTHMPNSPVFPKEPERSDDYTKVTLDEEQYLCDHYTAPVTPSPLAYTPTLYVLPTMEPLETFLMGDEVISTIPVRENDEFINSSVDDFFPNPKGV
ncbi:hypothetical protein Tco_0481762, partial [Tanacetum coccineum]